MIPSTKGSKCVSKDLRPAALLVLEWSEGKDKMVPEYSRNELQDDSPGGRAEGLRFHAWLTAHEVRANATN